MTQTWFTSDLHFSHKMMAKLRGFTKEVPGEDGFTTIGDTEAHDAAIVANWNRVVRDEDIVWVLGDVGMGHLFKFADRLRALKGRKHLIAGNHDDPWPGNRDSFKYQREWLGYFETVQPFARRRVDGRAVLLSHFPYEADHTDEPRAQQFRLRDEGEILLHGHTHWKHIQLHSVREIHVGLDAWDLAPVPMQSIQDLVAMIPAKGVVVVDAA